ncbi:MAG TPA: hypothetical protein VL382_11740 [Terriglobales bacterium]|nr:hypothetical protein [Terriglobales bacterium]
MMCAFVLAMAMSAFAQQAGSASDHDSMNSNSQNDQTTSDKKVAKAEKKEEKAAAKGKSMRLTGWVKTEGDKVTFVNDKDKQSWDVSNADMVKGHDGHHVKVKAKLDETSHSMTIQDVKMLRKSKQTAQEQNEEKK